MARQIDHKDLAPILGAAEKWINDCLINDGSVFYSNPLWTPKLVQEVRHAFVDHPDEGDDDFLTKLKGQMNPASPSAKQLMAEMLWALLLFPSNMKAHTKRHQIQDLWRMSGSVLPDDNYAVLDDVLVGVGSGGPGFNNYRPHELAFLIELTQNLKEKSHKERQRILTDYDLFIKWIDTVPQEGNRQFRHMLRFFAFPDRVERMSSNNDRRKILDAFKVAPDKVTKNWTDQQLDETMYELRKKLENEYPGKRLDFYMTDLKQIWSPDRVVRTFEGEITVVIPDEDENNEDQSLEIEKVDSEERHSIKIQAKLAEIGSMMNFKVWIPNPDKGRVKELLTEKAQQSLLETLPLNYDDLALSTIKLIDVLWLDGRAIVRAFEVEHTTSVYSGLLRMADLLTMLPNLDIRFHIVAPSGRREKVFRELKRPVFALGRSAIKNRCSFISYDSVDALRDLKHLSHMNEGVIADYEEFEEM